MELIHVRNPHQAIPDLLDRIERKGVERETRNGPAFVFPEPTTIIYEQPKERVVFWAERNVNPFFHLMESLWMLAARRDVKFVAQFVKRMAEFSDDSKKFHAAYGYRWRKHFRRDQLPIIIEALKKNPDCRRQVLGIWDVRQDLDRAGKDLPCNISATFQINSDGYLDMVVHNRSNDAICGALGANIVHFSILQEYIAQGVGAPIGKYWQVSSNMHVYKSDFEKYKDLAVHAADPYRRIARCPYGNGEVTITPVVDMAVSTWNEDLIMWMKNPTKLGLRSQFFTRTATPMFMAYKDYKAGFLEDAITTIKSQMMDGTDWKRASLEWLERKRHESK